MSKKNTRVSYVPIMRVTCWFKDSVTGKAVECSYQLPEAFCKPKLLMVFCSYMAAEFVTCPKYGCKQFKPIHKCQK